MSRVIHKMVAFAFKEDFPAGQMGSAWKSTMIIPVIGGGVVYAYPFGAVVFIDAEPGERQAMLSQMQLDYQLATPIASEEFGVIETDEEKPRVDHDAILLDKLTPDRTAVVCQTLAQTVSMEYYEAITSHVKSRVLDLIEQLRDNGKVNFRGGGLYKEIGYVMTIKAEAIGALHLLDKPDYVWEDGMMDRLYHDLRNAFDLPDRLKALEYKLKMTQEGLEVLVGLVQNKQNVWLNLSFVGLFLFEIGWEFVKFYFAAHG